MAEIINIKRAFVYMVMHDVDQDDHEEWIVEAACTNRSLALRLKDQTAKEYNYSKEDAARYLNIDKIRLRSE